MIAGMASMGNGTDTLHYAYRPGLSQLETATWRNSQDAVLSSCTYAYDAYHRLTGINLNNASEVAYTLNDKDQRTAASYAVGGAWNYSYDDKSQVTGAIGNNTTFSYAYDGIGNRLTAAEGSDTWSYTSNLLNQYTAINSNQPTYDADGNMLTTGDGWTYAWNGENRLIRAESGNTLVEMAYDYMGRRIEKKVYSKGLFTLYNWNVDKHYKFAYDDYKLIAIYDAANNNALLMTFTWQSESVGGLDVPVSMTYDGNTYYYVTDGNKNVTGLLDQAGNRVAEYVYGPFGQLLSAEGELAEVNPFRFSSEYADDETGLVYYNYRYYNAKLGRWIKRDPIGEKSYRNLYMMAANNPITTTDQLGLISLGTKLWSVYMERAMTGMLPPGRLYNLATRFRTFQFSDEYNELVERQESNLKGLIHAALVKSAREQLVTPVWQHLSLKRTYLGQANIGSYGIQSAGYLLGTAHNNHAQGIYDVKCRNGKFLFRKIKIDYEWYDEVDANSLSETLDYYYKTDGVTYGEALWAATKDVGPLAESLLPDIIVDKGLMAGYYVNIRGQYIHENELQLP